ncbi:hypothetical protein D3C87_1009260 [compost metagenome]
MTIKRGTVRKVRICASRAAISLRRSNGLQLLGLHSMQISKLVFAARSLSENSLMPS